MARRGTTITANKDIVPFIRGDETEATIKLVESLVECFMKSERGKLTPCSELRRTPEHSH